MKYISWLIVVFAAMLTTAAFARPLPQAEEDIHTGADLMAACNALILHDTSDVGMKAAAACKHFLGTMVVKVYKATPAGMPTQFNRLGPNGDETACFRLPSSLKFTTFAEFIAAYYSRHPELGVRPAFELGAHTLAEKYPCIEPTAP